MQRGLRLLLSAERQAAAPPPPPPRAKQARASLARTWLRVAIGATRTARTPRWLLERGCGADRCGIGVERELAVASR